MKFVLLYNISSNYTAAMNMKGTGRILSAVLNCQELRDWLACWLAVLIDKAGSKICDKAYAK